MTCRKCVMNIESYSYLNNVKKHNEIIKNANITDNDELINIRIAFHMILPRNSTSGIDKTEINARAQDIVVSLNEDFNSYNANLNIMNNFRYKSIVNTVFMSDINKQKIYLSSEYLQMLPGSPSNITFEVGNIYYYPVENTLNTSQHRIDDVDMMKNIIKQFIISSQANNIMPESVLNMWIVDVDNDTVSSFASFPWEPVDGVHGVVIHKRVFFPEQYNDTDYNRFKTVTHAIGHYLGLIHLYDNKTSTDNYRSSNIHEDSGNSVTIMESNDAPQQDTVTLNPLDANMKLFINKMYNPLFMNFMDCTYDKYVAIFTKNQFDRMRYMIKMFRPKLNSFTNQVHLPEPKYDPVRDAPRIIRPTQQSNQPFVSFSQQVPNAQLYTQNTPQSVPNPQQFMQNQQQSTLNSNQSSNIDRQLSQLMQQSPLIPDNGFFPTDEEEQMRHGNNPNITQPNFNQGFNMAFNPGINQGFNPNINNGFSDQIQSNTLIELINALDNKSKINNLQNMYNLGEGSSRFKPEINTLSNSQQFSSNRNASNPNLSNGFQNGGYNQGMNLGFNQMGINPNFHPSVPNLPNNMNSQHTQLSMNGTRANPRSFDSPRTFGSDNVNKITRRIPVSATSNLPEPLPKDPFVNKSKTQPTGKTMNLPKPSAQNLNPIITSEFKKSDKLIDIDSS